MLSLQNTSNFYPWGNSIKCYVWYLTLCILLAFFDFPVDTYIAAANVNKLSSFWKICFSLSLLLVSCIWLSKECGIHWPLSDYDNKSSHHYGGTCFHFNCNSINTSFPPIFSTLQLWKGTGGQEPGRKGAVDGRR